MVGPNGLEPSTSSVSRKRSNQTELRAYMRMAVVSILTAADDSGNVGSLLATGDGANNQERLGSRCDCVGQRFVGRFVGKILSAGKKAQERPSLQRHVVADRALKHGIAGLDRIEYG